MENLYLASVIEEITPVVRERTISRVFIEGYDLFIDLGLTDDRLLKVSIDPAAPCIFLTTETRTRSGDNRSGSYFQSHLRKILVGSRLIQIEKDRIDRKLRFALEGYDAAGDRRHHSIFVALTGRSSNVYLTDEGGRIESMWLKRGEFETGDEIGLDNVRFDPASLLNGLDESTGKEDIIERYFSSGSIFGPLIRREFLARSAEVSAVAALRSLVEDIFSKRPVPVIYSRIPVDEIGNRPFQIKDDLLLSHFEMRLGKGFIRYEHSTFSEAAQQYYDLKARATQLQKELTSLTHYLKSEIGKRETLLKAIAADRARHGDPERLKQMGDLLLANLGTSSINDGRVKMIDYYDPQLPEIVVEVGEGQSLQQAAAGFFARYQKARRALTAIDAREDEIRSSLAPLKKMFIQLQEAPVRDNILCIESQLDKTYRKDKKPARRQGKRPGAKPKREGGRWFLSADDFEIVVGRNDRDNDHITFRIARPQDIWLHAADYPGSHVLIRNPQRVEVPYRTIVEAAELAAYYSSAKETGKAAVHYTQRKYVTKPPRAKPGLVRLSSFKTVLVEPRVALERIN
jgi:predicted ribosome quality control (RQC) complex YloA/Tae2 family protein